MTPANVRIHGLATVALFCLIGDAWPQPSAGESIGEALVPHGWTVEKSNRYFGLLPSTSRMNALMKLRSTEILSVHVYDLRATRKGEAHHYATIAEVHHPDYLQFRNLREIYGNAEISRGIEPTLANLWQKMN